MFSQYWPVKRIQSTRTLAADEIQEKSAEKTMVAPVFEGMEEVSSFGGVALIMSLSEEEAFEIIKSEVLKYSGLRITSEDAPILKDVEIAYADSENLIQEEGKRKYFKSDLTCDGWNSEKNIAFEYVSESDALEWQEKPESGYYSNLKETALMLQKNLEESKQQVNIGVFYDSNGSEEVLRSQVRSFLDWLKGQGVI